MSAIHLTKEEFVNKVARIDAPEGNYLGDKPAIIDFYATWCGPCKALSPILEKVAEKYEGKIYVYKIDVDKESELSQVFNIRSVPTLLFVPLAEMPQMHSGMLPLAELERVVDTFLLK